MYRITVLSLVLTTFLVVRFIGTAPLYTSAQEATPAAVPNLTVGQLVPIGQPFEVVPGIDL